MTGIRHLDHDRLDHRQVGCHRNPIVKEARIFHVPVRVVDVLLVERPADPLRHAALDLPRGPMRFVREEWNPGARAVFEKFPGYVSRQEPASWLAGGKRIVSDRIEWVIIPDQATAVAALQNGEVDWLELPLPDLVPMPTYSPICRNGSVAATRAGMTKQQVVLTLPSAAKEP
jgi:hypothetical protein